MCWPCEQPQTRGHPPALLGVSRQRSPRSLQQGVHRALARCWLLLLSAGHSKGTCVLLQQLRAPVPTQARKENLQGLIPVLLIQIGSHYHYYMIPELSD